MNGLEFRPHGWYLKDVVIDYNEALAVYDSIIVGGGAAGCALARTLADSGENVLLIERGKLREDVPNTNDIFGAGMVLLDEDAVTTVVTTDGVFSHVPTVLGGGTAVNMGIVISESDEYFNFLRDEYGVDFDIEQMSLAYEWVKDRVAVPMPRTDPWSTEYQGALVNNQELQDAGYSTQIKPGMSWAGSSLFNSEDNFSRAAADVLLGTPGVDFPETLDLMVETNVSELVVDPVNLNVSCVKVSKTTPEDTAAIVSRPQKSRFRVMFGTKMGDILDRLVQNVMSLFGFYRSTEAFNVLNLNAEVDTEVCVRPGGKVILSAGAVMTPVILWRSGIGSMENVLNAGALHIKDVPEIGTRASDRVLVPLGLFSAGELVPEGTKPRICGHLALALDGDCDDYGFGLEQSDSCSASPIESIGGYRIAEGVILSTRWIFPPPLRNGALVDWIVRGLTLCGREDERTQRTHAQKIVCGLIEPTLMCFRKARAIFYFQAEPRSRGRIYLAGNGQMIAEGNYMSHPQDVDDAVRGVRNLVEMVSERNAFTDSMERTGAMSCPSLLVEHILAAVDEFYMQSQEEASAADKAEVEKWLKSLEVDREDKGLEGTLEAQLFSKPGPSTFPIGLPHVDDYDGIEKYVKTYMTSIWHWAGTVAMGVGGVVDENFRLRDFPNLYIVDASILPQITRMNPLATIMAIGRYVGNKLVQ